MAGVFNAGMDARAFMIPLDNQLGPRGPVSNPAMDAARAGVDLQAAEDTVTAAKNSAERWNAAALRQGRRRAGGSTYRRRGTVFSGVNQLDKANIESLTAARRKKAEADVASQQAQAGYGSVSIGAPIRLW